MNKIVPKMLYAVVVVTTILTAAGCGRPPCATSEGARIIRVVMEKNKTVFSPGGSYYFKITAINYQGTTWGDYQYTVHYDAKLHDGENYDMERSVLVGRDGSGWYIKTNPGIKDRIQKFRE